MTSIFEGFELGNKVAKGDYEAAVPDLRVDLVNMQYDLQQADFSALVLLVADDRKALNEAIDVLHEWLDARYLHTHVFMHPRPEELEYPAYWRYWRAMPPKGRIGLLAGAWPLRALAERLLEEGTDETLKRRFEYMNALERCLVDDGTVLIKLWLHVPKAEAKRRLKKARKDPDSEPYVDRDDQRLYELYDDMIPLVERTLQKTSTGAAPWHVIEATNARYRNLRMTRAILTAIRERLDAPPQRLAPRAEPPEPDGVGLLDTVDLERTLERDDYRERLANLQADLARLVVRARDKFATVLVFEGWDAAGKGGVIRRLTHAMYAQDYRVFPIAAPTDEELAHHYLWRFWRHVPRDGQVAIFDRSWYGRVLVERVEGLATPEEWRRAYAEINDFESQLAHHGMVVLKFWLHVDPEEQLRRFQAREQTAYKKYKITGEDYRNRESWSAYTAAVNEMVPRTTTEHAPWHLVAANQKRWARIQVLDAVVAALRARLKETS